MIKFMRNISMCLFNFMQLNSGKTTLFRNKYRNMRIIPNLIAGVMDMIIGFDVAGSTPNSNMRGNLMPSTGCFASTFLVFLSAVTGILYIRIHSEILKFK